MKILVCGGRDWTDFDYLDYVLSTVTNPAHGGKIFPEGWTYMIHGNARGADSAAGAWAIENCVPVLIVPAEWKSFGKKAGYLRNKKMLELGQPDLVIAFDTGGPGTKMMIELAKEAGVPVEIHGRS